jgi:ATP-dependent DNA ligase
MSEAGVGGTLVRVDRRSDSRPIGTASGGAQSSFEPKWDGFRAFAVVASEARLYSRRRNDLTYLCPSVDILSTRTG